MAKTKDVIPPPPSRKVPKPQGLYHDVAKLQEKNIDVVFNKFDLCVEWSRNRRNDIWVALSIGQVESLDEELATKGGLSFTVDGHITLFYADCCYWNRREDWKTQARKFLAVLAQKERCQRATTLLVSHMTKVGGYVIWAMHCKMPLYTSLRVLMNQLIGNLPSITRKNELHFSIVFDKGARCGPYRNCEEVNPNMQQLAPHSCREDDLSEDEKSEDKLVENKMDEPRRDEQPPDHQCSTEVLRQRARDLGIPQFESRSREDLQCNLSQVRTWRSKTETDLKQYAQVWAIQTNDSDTKAILVDRLIGRLIDTRATHSGSNIHAETVFSLEEMD